MSAEYISAALDLDVTGPDHTRRLALTLAQHLNAGDVLLLSGELGAGKTTFTRSLGEGLGVREGVISPTFVLSRVHPNLPDGPRPGGPDLVHVDAYRLSSAEELDDLDLETTKTKVTRTRTPPNLACCGCAPSAPAGSTLSTL